MTKYRIKKIETQRGNGTTITEYQPQYLFKILWIFPAWFDMGYSSPYIETAETEIRRELEKQVKDKKIQIIPYKDK